MKVKNLKARVTFLGANHCVIHTNSAEILQSYNSVVVIVPHDENLKPLFGKDWNYSRTTAKYVNQFLNSNTKEIQAKIDTGEYEYDSELK